MTKNFTIAKNGLIRGGSASYDLDPATGKIHYNCAVKVGIGFLSKTMTFQGDYQVDPKVLAPSSVGQVGQEMTIGNVVFKVAVVRPDYSMVDMTVTGQKMTGRAKLLTGQRTVVEADSLTAQATVSGFNLTIVCTPA